MEKMAHIRVIAATNERKVNEWARYRAEMLTLGFAA
jgi:hypothetical protein